MRQRQGWKEQAVPEWPGVRHSACKGKHSSNENEFRTDHRGRLTDCGSSVRQEEGRSAGPMTPALLENRELRTLPPGSNITTELPCAFISLPGSVKTAMAVLQL